MISSDEEDSTPLVRRDVEGRSSECHVRDWVGCLVSTGSIICGIICLTVINLYKETVKDEYGVVLDAGSTHTDMFVYKWRVSDIIKGTAQVQQIGQCTVTDEGGHIKGISSYNNPEIAGKSLHSCIESEAKRLIPSYVQGKSPIYLGATAGMRLLNETNVTAASEILRSVRKVLASSPFKFEDNYARIISGEEEGISSWVTVNYLKGTLDYSPEASQNQGLDDRTFGALDLGGASTQITFVPRNTALKSEKLTLYGKEYSVYTHSFLCYGMREAQRRFFAQLAKEAKSKANIANPCGPKGYNKIITSKYVLAAPCVEGPGHGEPAINYTFNGTGNYSLCAKEVSKLFNFTSCRGSNNCSFDGVYLPPTDVATFLAFSGFYGVINDLNLTSNASLKELQTATVNICETPWKEMLNIPSANRDLLAMYCFDAQYIFTMLSKGYHFNTTKANLRFVRSINKLSVGWALGFMINATNLLPLLPPSSVPINDIQSGVYLAVVIVGALFISAGILLCILSAGRIYKRRRLSLGGLVL